ncbi:SIR2 family NAD-dependent protein deacylase [Sphaerisporangium perillae]|uniref:SIR2 family NAD-dependent protein deacylase n=1 Tax=Sphaerisporangium perillae TaxID=2935860 RepID=UPI00200D3C92|nr:SIR2 family protein [Sphaerisporangium perillae]
MDDDEWNRLIDQLRNGDCTPFLGAGASVSALPAGGDLAGKWADRYDYPFEDDHDLARVTQFAALKMRDPVYVKSRLCRELRGIRPPDFNTLEPHALLARFPLPVYVTTNYDDFIVQSLKAAGKAPNVAMCPWYPDVEYSEQLFLDAAGWNPQPEAPLVYHLHGRLEYPTSVVLTEDDYLEFVTNLAIARIADDKRILPPSILRALTTRSLLFIGYSLRDWTFRVLFNGLLRAVPGINRRSNVSVQLIPNGDGKRRDAERNARLYWSRYFEKWQISIFWGSAQEFCDELRQRMELDA